MPLAYDGEYPSDGNMLVVLANVRSLVDGALIPKLARHPLVLLLLEGTQAACGLRLR